MLKWLLSRVSLFQLNREFNPFFRPMDIIHLKGGSIGLPDHGYNIEAPYQV